MIGVYQRRAFTTAVAKPLISTGDLEALLDQKLSSLRVLDATLPSGRDHSPNAFWEGNRIPTAQHFDLSGRLSNKESPYPFMLPHADTFREEMRKLDVRVTDHIITYDKSNMIYAPRAFWMFKVFGAANV